VLLAGLRRCSSGDEASFVNEGIIPAPSRRSLEGVCHVGGLQSLWPRARRVDLRVGGVIRSRYRADGVLGDAETIEKRHRRVPRAAHDDDAHPEAARFVPVQGSLEEHWTVFTLTPTDSGTHLRVASYGYGTDEESLAMRRFFERGNQQTIETLRRHFEAPAQ
jgi:uncharacterized protein YndB with AHSA1/START domain